MEAEAVEGGRVTAVGDDHHRTATSLVVPVGLTVQFATVTDTDGAHVAGLIEFKCDADCGEHVYLMSPHGIAALARELDEWAGELDRWECGEETLYPPASIIMLDDDTLDRPGGG